MVDAQWRLLVFDREQDFVRERGNQSTGACLPFYFSLYFLLVVFFLSLPLVSFLFVGISFRIPIS